MDYVEVEIQCQEFMKEILTAELLQVGYESFLDTPNGLKAYQSENTYDLTALQRILSNYPQIAGYQWQRIADQNWNQNWESSFEPIVIDRRCRVRASFHTPSPAFDYEIVIDPKMSFGTGHHETTSQMIRHQLEIDHKRKKVLDVGCGTGILSILAEKLGSREIASLDIDPWAVENAKENVELNKCGKVTIWEGTISILEQGSLFDIILANINRNVLLEEISRYVQMLAEGGKLIVSGFYTEDQPMIVKTCEAHGLQVQAQTAENKWACLIFERINE